MTTLDELARVERELRFFFAEGSSEILRTWADTIAAFIAEQRERDAAGPLRPAATLLCKLGSAIVHFEELHSPDGHAFDQRALDSLMADAEVCEWIAAMQGLALLPVKRKPAAPSGTKENSDG